VKITFKIQPYQTETVEATCRVFAGQPFQERTRYIRDLERRILSSIEVGTNTGKKVFRDSSYANGAVAVNFEQIFAAYSPETVRRVL